MVFYPIYSYHLWFWVKRFDNGPVEVVLSDALTEFGLGLDDFPNRYGSHSVLTVEQNHYLNDVAACCCL